MEPSSWWNPRSFRTRNGRRRSIKPCHYGNFKKTWIVPPWPVGEVVAAPPRTDSLLLGYALRVNKFLPLLCALILSAGLAAFQLGPALMEPNQLAPGNWHHPDCLSNHWLLIWVAEQISGGRGIGHNLLYYWPVGDMPVLAGNGSEGFVYLPFHLLLGWPMGVNFYVLTILTLNGLGGYALARAAGAERWTSLVTIGVTGLSPFAIQELSSGHFSQVSIFWMLFTLANWIELLNRPGLRRALWTGLLWALSCVFYWYYGLFSLGAAIVILAGHRWRSGKLTKRSLRLNWTAAIAGLALLSPWAVWFFGGWGEIPGTDELDVFPHPEAVNDSLSIGFVPFMVRGGRHVGYAMPATLWVLGALGAGLALWTAYRRQSSMVGIRHALGISFVALVFWGLSFGPQGSFSPYEMVYRWVAPLRRFWWPSRHIVLANAAWGVLGALALSSLLGRTKEQWKRWLSPTLSVGLVLSAVPMLELQWRDEGQSAPTRVQLMRVDMDASLLAPLASMEPGVLMEPPLSPRVAGTQQHLMYQTLHGMPLLSGHALWVDRVRPPEWDRFVGENSWLSGLVEMEEGRLEGPLRFESSSVRMLEEAGLRWIAIHREYFPLADLRHRYQEVFDAMFEDPVIRDNKGIRIYDIRNYTGIEEIDLEPWTWPEGVHLGGDDQPMSGRRPRSEVFGDYP